MFSFRGNRGIILYERLLTCEQEATEEAMSTSMHRIPFGEEHKHEVFGQIVYTPEDTETCHDCGASRGELHKKGCDNEQCPECGMQLIGCEHGDLYL